MTSRTPETNPNIIEIRAEAGKKLFTRPLVEKIAGYLKLTMDKPLGNKRETDYILRYLRYPEEYQGSMILSLEQGNKLESDQTHYRSSMHYVDTSKDIIRNFTIRNISQIIFFMFDEDQFHHIRFIQESEHHVLSMDMSQGGHIFLRSYSKT